MTSSVWTIPALRRQWSAFAVSAFGDGITTLAIPTTAVLVLHSSALWVGVLTASSWLAWPLLATRLARGLSRAPVIPVAVSADVVRLLLLCSIPIAASTGTLTLTQLIAVAAGCGIATVAFAISTSVIVPSVVPAPLQVNANALFETTTATAGAAGPSVGAVLVSAVSAPIAILADAASFCVSALTLGTSRELRAIRVVRPVETAVRKEGMLSTLRRYPAVRAIAVAAMISNLGLGMAQALLFVFAYRVLHLRAVDVGALLTTGAIAATLGAAIAPRIVARLGLQTALAGSTAIEGAAGLLFLTAFSGYPLVPLGIGLIVRGGAGSVWNVAAVTVRQQLVPVHDQPSVVAAARALGTAAAPVGAVAGGALATALTGVLGSDAAIGTTLAVSSLLATSSMFAALRVRIHATPPANEAATTA